VSLADLLVWVLRAFGALYLIGGLWMARQMWFWARLSPDMRRLGQALESLSADMGGENAEVRELAETDRGQVWWLFVGALITAMAGAAMLLAHRSAVPLLAAIILHQMLYFVRQRRRELAAKTPEAAAEARPDPSTVNGFFSALVMAVLAAWLLHEGALW
jgi:hypothetical protein